MTDIAHMADIAQQWHDRVWGDSPEGGAGTVEFDNTLYLVTTGTGDGNYAYDMDAVEVWLDDAEDKEFGGEDGTDAYSDFCDSVDPETDDDLAWFIWKELDVSIDQPGSGMPVIEGLGD